MIIGCIFLKFAKMYVPKFKHKYLWFSFLDLWKHHIRQLILILCLVSLRNYSGPTFFLDHQEMVLLFWTQDVPEIVANHPPQKRLQIFLPNSKQLFVKELIPNRRLNFFSSLDFFHYNILDRRPLILCLHCLKHSKFLSLCVVQC